MLNPRQAVAQVVLDHSECAEVFRRHHIDFCCQGELSLEEAARRRQVKLEELLKELEQRIAERREPAGVDPRTLSTAELVDFLKTRYHEPLRRGLPFALALAKKVSRVHGAHNPSLVELEQAVTELADALEAHLGDEEQELFPRLGAPAPERAGVQQLLGAMAGEHLALTALLQRVRAASDGFTLPDWACTSYRTLFSELENLERDVSAQVHLEQHVLRPRFLEA